MRVGGKHTLHALRVVYLVATLGTGGCEAGVKEKNLSGCGQGRISV